MTDGDYHGYRAGTDGWTLRDLAASPPAWPPPWLPGFWYGLEANYLSFANTSIPTSLYNSEMELVPLPVPAEVTVDRIAVYLSEAPSGWTLRMGIYAPGANGLPKTLVAETGEVTGASSDTDWQMLPLAATIGPGVYWLAAIVAETDVVASASGTPRWRPWGMSADAVTGKPGNGSLETIFYTMAYGALPATLPFDTIGELQALYGDVYDTAYSFMVRIEGWVAP